MIWKVAFFVAVGLFFATIEPIVAASPEVQTLKSEDSIPSTPNEDISEDESLPDSHEEATLLHESGSASEEQDEGIEAEAEAVTEASAEASASNETENGGVRLSPKRVFCRILSLNTNATTADEIVEEVAVTVVNGSEFLHVLGEQNNPNITNRSTVADCSLVFFYASWCPFSASAAPHFNALARLFPDVRMYAVDTYKFHSLNTIYGIMALPTVSLFHNGKPISKFNYSDFQVEQFARYLTMFTSLEPNGPLNVTEYDFLGPIPSAAVSETDWYLYLAWAFTLVCAVGFFVESSFCQRCVEVVRNTWREAEIQHEHQE